MKLIEQIDIRSHNTKWLFDLNEKGMLEIDNSFQRNYVWTLKNQIQLVESIITGYPIPEIYLWNTGVEASSGHTKYSIIDGQQRCGAIFHYIANTYKLKGTHLDKSKARVDEYKDRFFKDLESQDKKAIWSYIFSIRIVRSEVTRESIVNMFLRLNSNNMTLNPQELRNAEFDGEFLKLSAELSELDFWEKNKIFSTADRRRMGDISFVSTLLVFLKKGIEEDIGNTNLNQIYDLYNNEYPNKTKDKEKFMSILHEIDLIIENNSERIKILKRQVHFYSLFTLIYDLLNKQKSLTTEQISNYRNFIDNYNNEEVLTNYFENELSNIFNYKALVKEGTRQKSNRFERFKHLRKIITK